MRNSTARSTSTFPPTNMGSKQLDQRHPLATLDNYLDHIQHAVKVAGIDHVGLASDFDGGGASPGLERCEPDTQRHGGSAPARLHRSADRPAVERQSVARMARCRTRGRSASTVSRKDNFRCDLRCGDGRVPLAGHGAGRGRRRQGDLHAHRRRARFRRRSGDRRGHAVQDRLQHEGDDHRPARAPRGCRQAPVGRPCRQIPAAVQDERPVDHARDARARPAHPQQRTARRRRRSHAVAGA